MQCAEQHRVLARRGERPMRLGVTQVLRLAEQQRALQAVLARMLPARQESAQIQRLGLKVQWRSQIRSRIVRRLEAHATNEK